MNAGYLIVKNQLVPSTFLVLNLNFSLEGLCQGRQWTLVFHPELGRNSHRENCPFPLILYIFFLLRRSWLMEFKLKMSSQRLPNTHARRSVSGGRFEIIHWIMVNDSETSPLLQPSHLDSQRRNFRLFRKGKERTSVLSSMPYMGVVTYLSGVIRRSTGPFSAGQPAPWRVYSFLCGLIF